MLVCVGGCLLKRQDRPNVLWEIAFTQERFKDDWIFNNLPLAKFDFWKFWKSTTFLFLNSRFFCFCLTMFTKRICYNWNRRWVRSALKPSSYILCLGRWVYIINVETAELIRPKFFVGPHISPGKVYGCADSLIFDKFWKSIKK